MSVGYSDKQPQEGDDIVFGSSKFNYNHLQFGVMDLVDDVVMTQSSKVRPTKEHVQHAVSLMKKLEPRLVCVLHWKVRSALDLHAGFIHRLEYGINDRILPKSSINVVLSYFPNGSSISDVEKLRIFEQMKDAL